jgi:hypothetical protein
MAVDPSKIGLKPTDVFLGLRNKDEVTTVADVAGSLGGTSFHLETVSLDGTLTQYYVWYDGGADIDPAPAGRTGVQVLYTANDTAGTMASLTQAALAALSGLSARVSGSVVSIYNGAIASQTAATDVDSGFGFVNAVIGEKSDLGSLDGAPDFSPSFSFVDVKADQLGETLLDQVQNGVGLEITLSLLEVDSSKWSQIVGDVAGDNFTPGGGTLMVGVGTSKRFQNMKQYSKELVMKPSAATDDLENITIYNAFPDLSSITFSGTELHKMEVTFRSFVDTSKNDKISLYSYGDSSQDVQA